MIDIIQFALGAALVYVPFHLWRLERRANRDLLAFVAEVEARACKTHEVGKCPHPHEAMLWRPARDLLARYGGDQ